MDLDPLVLFQMCHKDILLPIPYARYCYVKFDDGSTSSFDPKGVNPDLDSNQEGTNPNNLLLMIVLRRRWNSVRGTTTVSLISIVVIVLNKQ